MSVEKWQKRYERTRKILPFKFFKEVWKTCKNLKGVKNLISPERFIKMYEDEIINKIGEKNA